MPVELSEPMIESLQSAARKLTGFRRRQFQAEMTLKHCDGRGRRAERVFGWGREAVDTGRFYAPGRVQDSAQIIRDLLAVPGNSEPGNSETVEST